MYFQVTNFVLPFMTSFYLFAIVTSIFGLAMGVVTSQRAAMATDVVGIERMPSSFGLTVFMQGVGVMIGPLFAGMYLYFV